MSDDTEVKVGITADDSGLVQGFGHAQGVVESGSAQMQESLNGITESFKTLAEIAGIGLSIEWAKEIITRAGEAAEQVENLSKTLGIASEELQAMSYGAGLVGGSLDMISSAGARLERSLEMAAAGGKQQTEALRALGIEASKLPELIKNPAEAFELLAKNVSDAGDGMGKTAAVMALFGRGGATMIPFLDKFGANLDEIKQKSRDLSVTLNEVDQGALVDMQHGLNEAGLAAKGMGNEFALALAPAVNAVTGAFVAMAESETVRGFFKGMRDDVAQFIAIGGQLVGMIKGIGSELAALAPSTKGLFSGMGGDLVSVIQEFQDGFSRLVAGAKQMWLEIKLGAETIWAEIVNVVNSNIHEIIGSLAQVGDNAQAFYTKLGFDAAAEKAGKLSASIHGLADSFKIVTPDVQGYSDAIEKNRSDLIASIASHQQWADETRKQAENLKHSAESTDHAGGALVDYNAKVGDAKDKTAELAAESEKLQNMLDALAGKVGGPYDQAWEHFEITVHKLAETINQMRANGLSADEALRLFTEGEKSAAAILEQTNQKLIDQSDIVGKLEITLNNNTRLLAATGVAHKELQAIIQAETEARKLYEQHLRDTATLTDEERQKIIADVDAHQQMDEAIKNSQAVMQGWSSVMANGLDSAFQTINKDMVEGGNLMKDLSNVWKSVVESILMQAEKLAIINPLLNAIFGSAAGGGNMLPTMFGGSGGSGGLMQSLMGGNSSGGGFGNLLNSWFGGGGSAMDMGGAGVLAQGGSSAFAGAQAAGYGSSPLMGSLGITEGGGYGASGAGAAGAGPGLSFMGVASGVMAGIGEYNAAGGGAGGIAGAAAYGVGTYFATAAAGAALSGGIAAGMAAIPVVGWIALAAMGINMLTHGGLFGTAGKPIGGNMTETIGPEGGNVSAEMTLKGKKPLFGGSFYDEKNMPVDQQTKDSVSGFFTALQQGTQEFAHKFDETMTATIVGGTFHETLDKTGKVTATDSTVLGVNRKGETQQQFNERLEADSFLAVMDKLGLGASEFVAGAQNDADKLFAATQDFAAVAQNVNTNLGNGFHFMALAADQSLVDVMNFVKGLNQGGETLSATYARLAQAQQQYTQFVGQFQIAPTYVDPFEASMANLLTGMQGAEAQANALAVAAGAIGAKTEDLNNIQHSYMQQVVQLTQSLQMSAQQLAFSLGLTLNGTLDQITAEINDLEKSTTTTTSSVQGFGNSIKQVSEQANAAMNLLLGNLSPLNDQQKLQVAMEGLHAGTVSADQVLQIGQNLYASSEAYKTLFNQVLPYAGQGHAAHQGGGTGGGTTTTTSTLSEADQAKLDALKKEQATLLAANKLGQFQTLAQQIEELSQAKGETIQQVLDEMGIKLKDLEAGLGIKTDDDFNAYMAQLQHQTDSAGNNTASIVGAINLLPQSLAAILAPLLAGKNVVAGPGTSAAAPGAPPPPNVVPTPPDRFGGGGRNMSDHEFVKAIGQEFREAMSPVTNGPVQFANRNWRAYAN